MFADTLPVLAKLGVYALGLWLIAVAALMASAPSRALQGLAGMGSTPLIHFGEHALRSLAGLALIGASETARFPTIFYVSGLFLVFSSALIVIAPRRWHHAYAQFWAQRLPVWSIRWLAPLSAAAGLALLWAAG
ncbi:hypothetical protein [Hyphobacterium sp.]|uniref:hypothetical protein n=1 Tax=Hyphobacterium sp. TaxID=2004662 RepID=UPI003B523736